MAARNRAYALYRSNRNFQPVLVSAVPNQAFVIGQAIDALDLTQFVTGDNLSFELAQTSAALPASLVLNGSVLEGTPDAISGPFAIVIDVANSFGALTLEFDLEIVATPPPTHTFDLVAALPSEIDFARSGTALYHDDAGVMQIAAANQPRFDHDPVSLAPRGLFLEASAQNKLLQGSAMDNAIWTKGSVSVTADAANAPDGTLTADLVDPGGGTTQCRQSVIVAENTTYTLSYYAHEAASGGNGLASMRAYDIPNGAEIVKDSAVAITAAWSRVALTFTTPPGCTSIWANTVYKSYGNYYVWGGQLEEGAEASSVILTTTVDVTRAADAPSINVDLGSKDVRITFDDDSETILAAEAVTIGWWPTGLTRPHIKKMELFDAGVLV